MAKANIFLVLTAAVLYVKAIPLPQSETTMSPFEVLKYDPFFLINFKSFFIDFLRDNNKDNLPDSVFEQLQDDEFFLKNFKKFFGNWFDFKDTAPSNSGSSYQSSVVSNGANQGYHNSFGYTSISLPGQGTKIDMFAENNGATMHKKLYQF